MGFVALQRMLLKGSSIAGLPSPAGARSWRFYAYSERAAKGHSLDTPGLFRPGNALELSPSGFPATRRGEHVSALLPPMPFGFAL
jgi:hypothetical protein